MSERLSKELPGGVIESLVQKGLINRPDLGPIEQLRENGMGAFVHGTAVTGEPEDTSDIDFSLRGILSTLPFEIQRLIGLSNLDCLEEIGIPINYVSTSYRGLETGRKISMHIQGPDFRRNYLASPYAAEYRSKPKASGASRYVMSGADNKGMVYYYGLVCPSIPVGTGVVNFTPQTGGFFMNSGEAIPISTHNGRVRFALEDEVHILNITTGENRTTTKEALDGITLWQLGLEACKMFSDTPVGQLERQAYSEHVQVPVRSLMLEAYNRTRIDPTILFPHMIRQLASLRPNSKGQSKVTDLFIEELQRKLQGIAIS